MTALYLEHYLDSLENLPVELQRNFTLMRDLDSRTQELMRTIDRLGNDYLINVGKMDNEQKKKAIDDIRKKYNKAKEYSDDKVQLSIQTYELVDKHIRRLDSDLSRFEAEIHDKTVNATRTLEEPPANKRGRKRPVDKERTTKKKSITTEEEELPVKPGLKKKLKKGIPKTNVVAISKVATTPTVISSPPPTNIQNTHSTDGIDMPVDPNEPTYCLCNQVSYGEMIGCDNSDCPIEWFHFACVKLTTKPKGKWYCPKCISDKKKK